MSDFDLRKFLAEQKAAKVETVKEEEAVQEEAVEETYHEGEDHSMEEGDINESVLAGIAALIASTAGIAKVLDYLKAKHPEKLDAFVKAADAAQRGSGKSGTGGSYVTQEGEETHEGEELNEEPVSIATVAAGLAAVFGGSVGLAKLMDKAEAGDFGEKGKAIAAHLRKQGAAASGAVNPGGTRPGSAVGENTDEELKESAFKATINDILNS